MLTTSLPFIHPSSSFQNDDGLMMVIGLIFKSVLPFWGTTLRESSVLSSLLFNPNTNKSLERNFYHCQRQWFHPRGSGPVQSMRDEGVGTWTHISNMFKNHTSLSICLNYRKQSKTPLHFVEQDPGSPDTSPALPVLGFRANSQGLAPLNVVYVPEGVREPSLIQSSICENTPQTSY